MQLFTHSLIEIAVQSQLQHFPIVKILKFLTISHILIYIVNNLGNKFQVSAELCQRLK